MRMQAMSSNSSAKDSAMHISVPSLPSSSSICSPTASIFSSLTSPVTPITPVFTSSSYTTHTSPIPAHTVKFIPTTPQVLAAFHHFAELPPELRRRIWTLTLPPPRRVELSYRPLSDGYRYLTSTGCGYTSSSLIPVALHVTQESRGVATETGYELSFGLLYTLPKIWFNPTCDVLYFGSGSVSGAHPGTRIEEAKDGLDCYKIFIQAVTLIDPRSLGRVKRIEVEETLFGSLPASNATVGPGVCGLREDWRMLQFWESIRKKFTGVEEVTFLLRREKEVRRGPPFPGLFLPVEWLMEMEWKERVSGLEGRVGDAVGVVGRGCGGGCEWAVPGWRVVEKCEGRGVG